MAKPVLQFTRLTNAGRLPDRFVACQVREFYESGFDGQARLFILVEVHRPWLTASQIGQALIQAFTGGYKDKQETDDLKHVEAALKRVNEALVHLTQQGESSWINQLHAVFVLEKAGEIHVAQTGRAGVFLCRDEKLSRVTELEGAQSAGTANRTFANITSGTLEPNDSLLIGSSELIRVLSPDIIEDSLKGSTAAEAANRYARILRQHQMRAAAGIVVRAYDPRELEAQPLLPDPDVIYLDEQPMESFGSSVKAVGRKIGRGVLGLGNRLDKTNRSIDKFARNSIAPKGKAFAEKSVTASKQGFNHIRTNILPSIAQKMRPLAKSAGENSKKAMSGLVTKVQSSIPKKVESSPVEVIREGMASGAGLIGQDLYTVRDYTTATKRSILSSLSKLKLPKLPKSGWLKRLFSPKNRPRLYIGIAALLLIVLVANIYILRSKQNEHDKSAALSTTIDSLKRQYDDAKLQLAFKKNTDQTNSQLSSIIDSLKPLESDKVVGAQATTLANQVEDTLDGQTNTVSARSPRKVATFDSASGLFELASDVVTVQSNGSKIFSSPIAGQLIDNRASLPSSTTLATGVHLDQSDAIMLLTSQHTMVKMSAPGTSPTSVDLASGSWENAVAMTSFSGNLYLLSPSANQVYKHAVNGAKYDAGTNFITDGTSVKNGISVAVDGSVYVLNSDGSVTKITRGKKDSLTVKGLPTGVTLADAKVIWTNKDSGSIYVLTKTSVIQLDKSGQYLHRYISPEFTNLSAFIVDPNAKQAWVLNDSTVWELNLTGA